MEAVVHPAQPMEAEPRLLLEQRAPSRTPAWTGSVLLHAAVIAVLASLPRTLLEPPRKPFQNATALIAPPDLLTQKEPNRGSIGKEFTLESLLPRPAAQLPPGPPASALRAPVLPKPKPAAPPTVPEPPKVESSRPVLAQAPPLGSVTGLPQPPQIQAEERKPKLAFETPGAPGGSPRPTGLAPRRPSAPSGSVTEATRAAIQAGRGGLAVGDIDLPGPGGVGPGLDLPPAPGKTGTALELMSDPMGVDFRPYLIQILATVKRNWLAVIPESARLGRVGKVQIQFAIARDGHVPKLVIAMPSGTDALDRAAVAGISASNPFPPLPGEFRGEQVRLQFTFLYNTR